MRPPLQVSHLLVINSAVDPEGAEEAPSSELIARLVQLVDNSAEDITYVRIKPILVREFGPTAVKRHKGAISNILINAMNARRDQQASKSTCKGRHLSHDLRNELESACKDRYEVLKSISAPLETYKVGSCLFLCHLSMHTNLSDGVPPGR
jgi:hypothetical protein